MRTTQVLLLALALLSGQAFAAFLPSPAKSTGTRTQWGIAVTTTPKKPLSHRPTFGILIPPAVLERCLGKMALAVGSFDDNGSSKKPYRIIIAGAPASGKGTQCEIIKQKFGVVHLSTGDMLRAAVSEGTEIGKLAKDYMDNGKLVPDEVIIGIVKERLAQSDCVENGWLLDGFPRTRAQAEALEDAGVQADCFLFLHVPDEILVERVVGRRTDPETGKIYHMTFSPPDAEEVKARLVQRSDDTEEKVKVRLEQFHANVDAVKDKYTDISVFIDGNQPPNAVSKAIMDAIAISA